MKSKYKASPEKTCATCALTHDEEYQVVCSACERNYRTDPTCASCCWDTRSPCEVCESCDQHQPLTLSFEIMEEPIQ